MPQDIWEDGLNFIEDNWNTYYGTIHHEYEDTNKEVIRLATGGWSENEKTIELFSQMYPTFWALYWQLSKRGGYYEFAREI